jgi:hypothetical protein
MPPETDLEALYRKRASRRWLDRLLRLIQPPAPFILNPREPKDFPLGRWNLYIGGAGRVVDGYINLDLFAIPGVNVAADAAQLPFPTGIFQRVECDAVLEHMKILMVLTSHDQLGNTGPPDWFLA